MTTILKPESIKVDLCENKLTCTVTLGNLTDITITAYRLFNDKNELILHSNSSLYSHTFEVKKNSSYRFAIFYKNCVGEVKYIYSAFSCVKLKNTSIEDMKKVIIVTTNKNKVLCNAVPIREMCSKVSSFTLRKHNAEIITTTAGVDFQANFQILSSGHYEIIITYENFDGIENYLTFSVITNLVELTSATINNYHINKQRKSLYLIANIIYAFVLREFQRKYDKGYFRYFSLVLGPTVQLIILMTIFAIAGRRNISGLNVPLFVITGILPYNFFTAAGNCLTIVSANRSLLSYKQVKIIDTIFASIVMELIVVLIIFILGVGICAFLGMRVVIYNPLSLIVAFLLLFFFTFGLAMILAVIGFYFAEFNYAIQVIFRAMFYISGVFFSIESIPVQYQKYVLWNPLLQIIEFIRCSFVSFGLPNELSYMYLLECVTVIFLIGISLYFVNRNKFMVNDRAR